MAEEKENARTGAARNGLAPVGVSSGPIHTIPEGDKVEFQLGNDTYAVPNGNDVLFELKCDVALEEITAEGHITTEPIASNGEATHYENIVVGGKPTLGGGRFESEITHYPSVYDSNIKTGSNQTDGYAEVVNSVRGIASAPLAIQSDGLVQVLFNVTGDIKTGDITSQSQRVEVITLIEGKIGGEIHSSGRAEFVGFISVKGDLKTGDITSSGIANQGVTVKGDSTLSIEGVGAVEVRWFGMVEEGGFPTPDITSTGQAIHYREVRVVDSALTIQPNTITSRGRAEHYQEVAVTGDVPFAIESSGRAEAVNLVRGINDQGVIESVGEAEFTKPKDGLELRYVFGWIRHGSDQITSQGRIVKLAAVEGSSTLGDITSSSGVIASYVEVLDSNLRFSDGISFLTGRVDYGFGDGERIDQIYEVSTSRSMNIPLISPDPRYAVKLNTTDFNLTDTELRRGTTVFEFRFDYDYPDIKQIKVWLETEDGRYTLDTMRWTDRRFNNKAPHILSAPIRAVVPVHCISKKSNQFVLELEFTDEGQARYLRPSESYLIPFQAHFDNRNPYINIADHEALLGYGSETTTLITETDSLQVVRYVYDDMLDGGPYGSRCTTIMTEYDELKLTTLVYEDEIWPRLHSGNTYLDVEYVDLSNINIGG